MLQMIPELRVLFLHPIRIWPFHPSLSAGFALLSANGSQGASAFSSFSVTVRTSQFRSESGTGRALPAIFLDRDSKEPGMSVRTFLPGKTGAIARLSGQF
jgi:hypothetical protein